MRAIAAVVLATLVAGCGATRQQTPIRPVSRAVAPEPFGTGNDRERAEAYGEKVFWRWIEARYPGKSFQPVTVAYSWTRTHLLIQFDGGFRHPGHTFRRELEVRVLVALRPGGTLATSMIRIHTLAHPGVREQP